MNNPAYIIDCLVSGHELLTQKYLHNSNNKEVESKKSVSSGKSLFSWFKREFRSMFSVSDKL